MTPGPYAVDNMLYSPQQGLGLSDTQGPPFWTQERKQGLKPAEASGEVST